MTDYECARCGERPGTCKYSQEGGALAITHGFWEWWCEPCVFEVQLAHAREQALRIPHLEARLAAALREENKR